MNIYLKKSKWQGKGVFSQKMIIGFLTLSLVIIFLNLFNLQIKDYFYFISYPIAKSFWQAGNNVSSIFEPFLSAGELRDENNYLKQENKKLFSKIFILEESFKENMDFQEVLKNNETNKFQLVLAKTIGLDISRDFILLNKGRNDGISENMPVISKEKVLYGKVFSVYENFSQVMLISNNNSTLNVKINSEEPINNEEGDILLKKSLYGVVKGSGALSLYLDLVDLNAEIGENDVLMTSGLEGTFPNNLLVGKIKSLYKNDLKPFQTAEVQSFFDTSNLENLFIITNYLQK